LQIPPGNLSTPGEEGDDEEEVKKQIAAYFFRQVVFGLNSLISNFSFCHPPHKGLRMILRTKELNSQG
jgi:hypothetical protein